MAPWSKKAVRQSPVEATAGSLPHGRLHRLLDGLRTLRGVIALGILLLVVTLCLAPLLQWQQSAGAVPVLLPGESLAPARSDYSEQPQSSQRRSPWEIVVKVAAQSQEGRLPPTYDRGELTFNRLFKKCPVVKYTRNGTLYVIYIRSTPFGDWNAYHAFTKNWTRENNVLNKDFELYNNMSDAAVQQRAWAFCSYFTWREVRLGMGFPAECGQRGRQRSLWFSLPKYRKKHWPEHLWGGASLEIYVGDDCPYKEESTAEIARLHAQVDWSTSAASSHEATCRLREFVDLTDIKAMGSKKSLKSAIAGKDWQGKSCAVVGSSGALLLHRHGKRIDKADVVIRFNVAPVDTYEIHVGGKDNMRLVNMNWATKVLQDKFHPSPDRIYILALPLPGSRDEPSWEQLHQARPDLHLFQVKSETMWSVTDAIRSFFNASLFRGHRQYPTSGAMGLAIALSFCSKIEAFGLAISNTTLTRGEDISYHYYEAGGAASENAWHQTFEAEKHLWRFLATNSSDIDRHEVAVIKPPRHCK